jgi:mycothiol maleylpyruvate isomerase-like protein
MSGIRDAYLDAARSAAALLAEPEVAAGWTSPSALDGFTVGGLAAHLAVQVLFVPATLDGVAPDGEPVPLLGHYERVTWIGAALDADVNVAIRRGGEAGAAEGPAAVAGQVEAAVRELAGRLATEPGDRVVRPPAGPWALRLDDFLVTRMMEIAVHSDDLAYSVGIPTPELPSEVMHPVLELLTRLAVRRHGPVPVLRSLSRAERAPETVTAF